jgi:parvulin-like peptidyl-prolyl isomerase
LFGRASPAILRDPLPAMRCIAAIASRRTARSFFNLFRPVDGETAMARKEARSNSNAITTNEPPRPAHKWKKRLVFAASGVAVVGVAVAIRAFIGSGAAEAQIPNPFRGQSTQTESAKTQAEQNGEQLPKHSRPQHDVMAVVNGQDIRRDALAAACAERFGEEVLEGLVNKRLILHHCRNRQVDVTEPEIDAEIDRMAARFKIGRQQWLEMLERERGVNVQQYKRDILWPTLALRKLAAKDLEVNEQQIEQAYQAQFGPSVQCRLIVVNERNLAEQLHRQLSQNSEDFARLAMQHSVDVNSASIGGLIQPVRRFVGDPAIERAVFDLQEKQLTPVIPVAQQFAILKCEQHIPPRNVPLTSVRNELIEQIKEEKLREVAGTLFEQLQKNATIQNVWNQPQLRAANPGVVATVNGDPIRYQELAEECLARYGQEVLEVEISHLLLQQALAQAKLSVTQQDLDAEIAHAAKLAGVVDKQGRPDVQQWLRSAIDEQKISEQLYMRDAVWPSAALKKLTGGTIEVSKEDLNKSYQANYGERVRCRAIVLGTMRSAQEVWEKARQNPSIEYFGDLAAEYSIEAQSKSLRGEVPPIGRHGGQPQFEQVAFTLQSGELSGVIQLGNQFVILKCEGRTEPVDVNPQVVQEILQQDIYEKKLRMAMSERFDQIRSKARIDNYLAGTSQSPDKVKDPAAAAPRVDSAVRQAGSIPPR